MLHSYFLSFFSNFIILAKRNYSAVFILFLII
uniref:Uncharacterized protein n=1 Tax=Myoviridae sp. ctJ2i1 TaxID=2825079 RepID=A0A8S5V1R3_9CAUD|nr:MAG TPA: hypothetical protein [Myoviridae sp. ctJ2i1]